MKINMMLNHVLKFYKVLKINLVVNKFKVPEI